MLCGHLWPKALDHLLKAVELAEEAGWAAASHTELILQAAVAAATSEEREAALPLERERKPLEFSSNQTNGKCTLVVFDCSLCTGKLLQSAIANS